VPGRGPARIRLRARRGRRRSATCECARQSGSARQTDKPAGCQPCRLSAPTLLAVCLSFQPSNPPPTYTPRLPHFSFLHLSQCHVGSVFRAYTAQAHAHTRTYTDTAELGYNLPSHFPRRHHLPCTTSQTHPLSRPANGGVQSGRAVSPPYPHLSLLLLSLRFLGEDPEDKGAQT
jgi:hypothetical protein